VELLFFIEKNSKEVFSSLGKNSEAEALFFFSFTFLEFHGHGKLFFY
jgi:hypothetical protein